MEENEVQQAVESGAEATANLAVTPDTAADEGGSAETSAEPEKKLTYREKIEQKAAELAAKTAKEGKKEAPKPAAAKPAFVPKEAAKPTKEVESPTKEVESEPEKEASDYKPNFKFRFTDDKNAKQEKEFPDWAKAAIKDPESEKEIRSLFEKAHGIDFMQPRYKQMKEQFNTLNVENQSYKGAINRMKEQYAKGNLRYVFDTLKIPEEKVLQYALERAKYYELPPEQRSVIDRQQSAEDRAAMLEQQQADQQQEYMEVVSQQKQLLLDMEMSKPDVSSIATDLDTRLGKQGAFLDLVAQHGETTWHRSQGKIDLTPAQAIQQVIAMYGLKAPAAPAKQADEAADEPAPAQKAKATVQKPAVKVIPNLSGRSTSSASGTPAVKSLADIRRISKEKFGS